MDTLIFLNDTHAVADFCQRHDIRFLGLFGSYARHQEKKDSDVDLLVEFKNPVTYFKLLSAEEELGKELHRKVELVTKKALSPRIQPFVIKDLQTIYGQRS